MNYNAYKIDLATLTDFTEVSQHFKDLNIINYVYWFQENKRGIIKFGYSADNSAHYGERVYRQAGHLHGWSRRLQGCSGSDMRIICDDYQKTYNEILDRKNMTLFVIKMNRKSIQQCKDLERELIDECVKHNDRAPLGNRDSETKLKVKRTRNQKLLSQFFDTENT